jgi:hypothetical protein
MVSCTIHLAPHFCRHGIHNFRGQRLSIFDTMPADWRYMTSRITNPSTFALYSEYVAAEKEQTSSGQAIIDNKSQSIH